MLRSALEMNSGSRRDGAAQGTLALTAGAQNSTGLTRIGRRWDGTLNAGDMLAFDAYRIIGKAGAWTAAEIAQLEGYGMWLTGRGAAATIWYATEAGVTISGGQTIGAGAFEALRGVTTYAVGAINRALTVAETARLQRYLAYKAGVTRLAFILVLTACTAQADMGGPLDTYVDRALLARIYMQQIQISGTCGLRLARRAAGISCPD